MTQHDWETRILQAVEDSRDELLELAGLLIRTPSENPPGDCTEIADVIAGYLRGAGVSAELLDAGQGRVSVVAHQGERQTDSATSYSPVITMSSPSVMSHAGRSRPSRVMSWTDGCADGAPAI